MPGRGRMRPRSPRQEEIARVGRRARVGPQGGPGQGQGNGLGLGRQLSRRVKSGAITSEQAQQTAKQRQTFKAAFGPDWRAKVFGDRGYAQRTRTALAANPQDPQVAALNTNLMAQRQKMLEAARKRLSSGLDQGEGRGPVSRAPVRRARISPPRRRRSRPSY